MANLVPIQKQQVSGTLAIQSVDDVARIAKMMADSGFFSDCKQAAQAGVKILAGIEIGIPAFAAMSGIHLIQGKPALGANLIAAKVKSSGKYDYRVLEHSDQSCRIAFYQGKDQIGVSEFSAADAKRMGTKNMDKMPKNMLFARAISNGVRWYCPDLFVAPVYTPEELGATVSADGDVLSVEVQDISEPQPDPWVAERLRNLAERTGLSHEEIAKICKNLGGDYRPLDSAQFNAVRDAAYAAALADSFPSKKAAWQAFESMERAEVWGDEALWEAWQLEVAELNKPKVEVVAVEEEF